MNKYLLKAFLFLLILSFQNNASARTKPAVAIFNVPSIRDTSVAPNYGDLNIFWADFKKYALAKNVKMLAEMTAFKFMDQNNMITKDEFLKDFSFARSIKTIRKAGPPKYTKDKHTDYDTNKYLGHSYSAVVDDIVFYFCKIKGKWKFTGISYGE